MGGGGSLNAMIHDESPDGHPSEQLKRRFAKRAEAILKLGAVGFGELAVLHLSVVPGQEFLNVPADHPLLLMLADIAAKHDVVIDVHFDLVREDIRRPDYLSDENPAVLKRNLDSFERLLEHNRDAKICWAHAGSDRLSFWTAAFTREMLARHPNLYMSLRLIPSKSGVNNLLTKNLSNKRTLKFFYCPSQIRFIIDINTFNNFKSKFFQKDATLLFSKNLHKKKTKTIYLYFSKYPHEKAKKIILS